MPGSFEPGFLLYHHSCISAENLSEKNVITVSTGFDPGSSICTEYDGHFLEARSATNLDPILLQLGSLLLQAILEQGQGNSSLSYNLQQGPIIL